MTHADEGITPAYAGKSPVPTAKYALSEDHPRVCGEKQTTHKGRKLLSGSPPRMRGKAVTLPLVPILIRITPAYAGKRTAAF